ncbi:hypothetical protein PG996_007693 [Apiospora saccharicola]|uniref:Uncharacterized protein n=1 Tax=Apiospora saccharicola TaxID=335842 RepID=A0ABR1VBL0_9PEZI
MSNAHCTADVCLVTTVRLQRGEGVLIHVVTCVPSDRPASCCLSTSTPYPSTTSSKSNVSSPLSSPSSDGAWATSPTAASRTDSKARWVSASIRPSLDTLVRAAPSSAPPPT